MSAQEKKGIARFHMWCISRLLTCWNYLHDKGPGDFGTFLQGAAAIVALGLALLKSDEIADNIRSLVKGVTEAKTQIAQVEGISLGIDKRVDELASIQTSIEESSKSMTAMVKGVDSNVKLLNALAERTDENTKKIQETLARTEEANAQIQKSLFQLCEILLKNTVIASSNQFNSVIGMWSYFGKNGLVTQENGETGALVNQLNKKYSGTTFNQNTQIQALSQFFAQATKNPCVDLGK